MLALTTFTLASLFMAGVLLALFLPQISYAAQMKKRRDMALGLGDAAALPDGNAVGKDGRPNRRPVEETLRELEKKNRIRNGGSSRATLSGRLRQAGLNWSPLACRSIGAGIGLIVTSLFWLVLGVGALASIGVGLAVALWLPKGYVGMLVKRRQAAFTTAFTDAVDIIVRGVRAGIPLGDCLRIVATETQEPVRVEFRTMVEDLTMGLAVEDAVQRMSDRVTLEEARFFAIVITIQTRTGGNLSEALGNLSIVLRDRAKMRRKIKAMSSEANASAAIIGSLPPIVCILVFLTSPGYVGLLFTTTPGNLVLAASGFWMLCGTLIMRSMINFDF